MVIKQSRRTFVPKLDFVTTVGHLDGGDARANLGLPGAGPMAVVTDLCEMEPDPITKELIVMSLHPGVSRGAVEAATGWPIRFAEHLGNTAQPTEHELNTLRDLKERTARAHGAAAEEG